MRVQVAPGLTAYPLLMRWMIGADVNQQIETARRALDAPHAYGRAPVGLFWSTGFDATASARPMPHADHAVLRASYGDRTVAVVNCTWQWGGDEDLLTRVAGWADIMLMIEARTADNRPLPVASFIRETHRVRQSLTDAAHAGSAIAVRRDPDLTIDWSRLSPLSPAGHAVQERFIRTAQVRDRGRPVRFAAAHLGLRSTGVQDDGERALRAWVARARAA